MAKLLPKVESNVCGGCAEQSVDLPYGQASMAEAKASRLRKTPL